MCEDEGAPIIGVALCRGSDHRVVADLSIEARVTGGRKHEGAVVVVCEGEGECVGRLR